MILNVRYLNSEPEQYQKVRMFTIYPHSNNTANPEIVIHFYVEEMKPQMNINLSDIRDLVVYND